MVSTNITELLATYIHALHILHYHGVLDGYGHLSVRNPNNPPTFFLMHQMAPALVSGPDDIGEYRVSDAEPTRPGTRAGVSERFIHSEVLKRYPGVNVVLHGHPEVLVSYSISHVPLRAATHMSGFQGERTPIFDITRYYLPNDTQDFLVKNQRLGAALADVFNLPSCSSPEKGDFDPNNGHHNGCARNYGNGYHDDEDDHYREDNPGRYGDNNGSIYPTYNLTLMQSHGFTAVATDIKAATYEGIYAVTNAKVEAEALKIRHAYTGRAAKEDNGITYLTPRQIRDSWATELAIIGRPWGLWVREVKVNPLYVNELDPGR